MSQGGGGEKTEKPTAKRQSEARKQGQIARTPDLGAWLALGVVVALTPMAVRATSTRVQPLLTGLQDVAADPEPARALSALATGGAALLPVLAPVLAASILLAVASSVAQGGFLFATEAAKPKWSRLNPLNGLKNLVGFHSFWQMAKSLLKTVVIGAVMYTTIVGLMPRLLAAGLPLGSLMDIVGSGVASLVRICVGVGLVIAVADYAVQKRKTAKDMRMSKQEIKDERKNADGNPEVKAAIKGKQRSISRNRMMAAIQSADVVLVNPTHVAVALKYEPSRGAPRVVAKGRGLIATKIRERATEHGVPMVSDVPLARALFAAVELEQEVPAHLYVAVAQVLAFVMALRKRGAASGLHANPAPVDVDVPDIPGLPPVGH